MNLHTPGNNAANSVIRGVSESDFRASSATQRRLRAGTSSDVTVNCTVYSTIYGTVDGTVDGVYVCMSVLKLLPDQWTVLLHIWWNDAPHTRITPELHFVTLGQRSRSPWRSMSLQLIHKKSTLCYTFE